MDEKHAAPIPPPPARRGLHPVRLAAAIGYLLFCGFLGWYLQRPPVGLSSPPPVEMPDARVPLEAHIMSKCPDARDCLRDLVLPAMQKVHDKVDFTLSFIGTCVSRKTERKENKSC